MSSSLARAFVEDYDKSDIERVADGIIATAENLRDGKISAKAARIASANFLAMLDAVQSPATPFTRRCSLLAFLTAEWADELTSTIDPAVANDCRELALRAITLVQTTMTREAGRIS